MTLDQVFARAKSEKRAVLIGYMPACFPDKDGSKRLIAAMIDGGVDVIEVGFPYSDPVMDGPIIQEASQRALEKGFTSADLFKVIEKSKATTVTMTYWNPIERMGVPQFLEKLKVAGGVGVITPDLTIDESAEWITKTSENTVDRIYVVAPSTSDDRLRKVAQATSGFIYAASLMGVTGTRSALSGSAKELVARLRKVTTLPIAVGLGVSNAEQAREIASFADGVIVGSAFIKLVLDSASIDEAIPKVKELAEQLAQGVRRS